MKNKSRTIETTPTRLSRSAANHTVLLLRAALLILCLAICLAPDVRAVGFRLPNQDPEAIARGNAFVATADNPSAIYYNPAGITQLTNQQLSYGIYFVSVGGKFEAANGGGNAETKAGFQEVPQFYYVRPIQDTPLTFGLGVYVPYGLGIDYGLTSPFRDSAQDGNLLYATINPTLAWKITPELSIAAGPTINYSKVNFNAGLVPSIPGSQFHFVGDDWSLGFHAGLRYQPCDKWAFGLNYHSDSSMNYKGHASFALPGSQTSNPSTAAFHFPQYAVGGVSFRPTDKWNLEFDVDWTDWNSVKQTIFQNTPGGNITFPFHYHDSCMFELGVTRQIYDTYYLSGGYFYSMDSVPNASYNPIVPDSNLHLFSAGISHRGEKWGWAISYTLAINPSSSVSGSSYDHGTDGFLVNGTYRTINNAINASILLKF